MSSLARTQGETTNHRDSTLPQAKMCCRLWNHALKDTENLKNNRKQRNSRYLTIQHLYSLCLVLANTQTHLTHGANPGSYNLVGPSRAMNNLVQCLYAQRGLRKTSDGQPPEEEGRAGPNWVTICNVACLLPGDGTETRFQYADPGKAKLSN